MNVVDTGLYDRLEVSPTATDEEIKRSYKKLAMRYHPDKNPDTSESNKFKEITEAYDILSDPEKRSLYNRFGMEAYNNVASQQSNPTDIFGSMFNHPFASMFNQQPHRQQQPKPQSIQIECTLEEIYTGAEKQITFERNRKCKICSGSGNKSDIRSERCSDCGGRGVRVTILTPGPNMFHQYTSQCDRCHGQGEICDPNNLCDTCHGMKLTSESTTLKINIPRGIQNGQSFLVPGEGSEVLIRDNQGWNIIARDIAICVIQRPHPQFKRINTNDLQTEISINLFEALAGVTLALTLLDGTSIAFSVRDVIKPDDIFMITGAGMQHGNLYIKFKIIFPDQPINFNKLQSILPQSENPQVLGCPYGIIMKMPQNTTMVEAVKLNGSSKNVPNPPSDQNIPKQSGGCQQQ
jgi:DnaJ family protein A protein 2